jgi:hypothetical protein
VCAEQGVGVGVRFDVIIKLYETYLNVLESLNVVVTFRCETVGYNSFFCFGKKM